MKNILISAMKIDNPFFGDLIYEYFMQKLKQITQL